MSKPHSSQLESLVPRALGLLASVLGIGFLMAYPLAPAEAIPGSHQVHSSGAIEASHPLVVYCSVIGGSMLLTWGVFALRFRTVTPLTPRRAFLAPLIGIGAIVAGVGRFTYEWLQAMPFEAVHAIHRDGTVESTTWELSVLETVQMELTVVQFVALASISMTVTGAIATKHDRRRTVASALVPFVIVGFGIGWTSQFPSALEALFLAVLVGIPFSIGYVTTQPEY